MVINNNLSALFAQRMLGINNKEVSKQLEKLASGLRINRAADDSANLAVSEKMRAQIRGLQQASANTQNGVSFIQTTEAHLVNTTDILQRLRELAVQASNGIYSDEDRLMIQVEVSQLVSEIDRIASHAQFNGMNLLTGRFARQTGTQDMFFHVGANMDQRIQAHIGEMTAQALGMRNEQGSNEIISLRDTESSNMALGSIDAALRIVNKQRADLGALQNRMEHAQRGIDIARENLQASESRIRDADMAAETTKYVKDQILMQAAVAMLSHANGNSQNVLRLLGM